VSRLVAWSGHRPDLFRDPESARLAVEREAQAVCIAGFDGFLVGGQRGVDTWAAQCAIALAVPFWLVLPFETDEFTRDWSDADRGVLQGLRAQAAGVRIARGFSQRNQHLASGAQLLVAVWTGVAGGGTSETLELARQAGTRIREILVEPAPSASSAHGRGI
jgi:hypothetical protein